MAPSSLVREASADGSASASDVVFAVACRLAVTTLLGLVAVSAMVIIRRFFGSCERERCLDSHRELLNTFGDGLSVGRIRHRE